MLSRSIRNKMKFNNRGTSNLSGGLAVAALASSALYMPTAHHTLVATAFSLNVNQQGRVSAAGFGSTTQRSMSKMDQSFRTWSFDEPCSTMAWNDMSSATLSATEKADKWDEEADLVVVGVFAPQKDEDDSEEKEEEEPTVTLEGSVKDLDEKLGGALTNLMLENAKAFNHGAEPGTTTPTLRIFRDGKSQRFVVMGMGTIPDKEKADALAGVGSKIGRGLATTCDAEKKVKTVTILLPSDAGSSSSLLTDLSTEFHSNLYADNRFRTGKKVKIPAEDLDKVNVISEGSTVEEADTALERGKKLASGVFLTKDIVNGPHNVLNSVSLAQTAKRIAEESGGSITCKILGKAECEERGMGAYLGVARASETPPQFIHLTYTPPEGKVNKRVGIIGKGLLFDTGGYNIKTAMMELMKFDCGGAAAVLGKIFGYEYSRCLGCVFSQLFSAVIS